MIISSEEEVQGAFAIVQRKVFAPMPRFVTVEVGLEGVVIVPLPLINVHVPVPIEGVFPARLA